MSVERVLAIPLGGWVAWSLWGRRAGLSAAVLFAFSEFLTNYGQEARMYSLMALLGLLATAGFLHGVYLISVGELTVGGLIAFLGLLNVLGYPAFMPIWALSVIQLGYASSHRILERKRYTRCCLRR